MEIWKHVQNILRGSPWNSSSKKIDEQESENDGHLQLARENLRELLSDDRLPGSVRDSLKDDFHQVQAMLDKLEHGHLHIAVFGRVSVGKSALLNALLGEQRFAVSALHGETRHSDMAAWREVEASGVFLIDTPGINEISGEERERMAEDVASRADLVLFVVDGDLTQTEHQAMQKLSQLNRPLVVVLNKADRYTRDELELLLGSLQEKLAGIVSADYIVATAASPAERIYLQMDEQGQEQEIRRTPQADVLALTDTLWLLIEKEGMALSALNASLFAGQLSDEVAERVVAIRQEVAERVIRGYCLGKGIAVAVNPIPVADLVAALALDASMVVHLAKVYGMSVSRGEAGQLIKTIGSQMALLMATVWSVNLAASALKASSAGLSTVVTAAAQGGMGYYTTYVVGLAAQRYFSQGRSWGSDGPKTIVQQILDSVDKDSILQQASDDIRQRLKLAK
ncbi:MAG: GTP-binding protein [Candidatus Thiodiazotropha lotti]|uniref:GTP-binding protein n=1 Tax=Candidatus Thiodiazotropha lotti TaxID=2792787 RepID=A0A9E4K1R2_9GAMM|nr:GTP-binding protein [Candidatus Thiodiazotropha lotti]MCG7930428.1 GTP-binding protein [Candidatus Thiodiazotropha lotti]MCG7937732.1 GTP-binding protein [Candidatus Thiodiazotropha lotti]MCW4202198.1 GTP-binding protein [Candidatus Thiodiazotropha lotti]MCW4220272.1 GTP-binding protein [Candidatus Thiodiazotropha lotti]